MQIKIINTQRVLSKTQIGLAEYAINPYRGCEFGCFYCYIKHNKNVENSPDSLGIKINAPQILNKELYYRRPRRVLLGSTTECFQYKELEYKLTEKILKILNCYHIPYTILTKSHLITSYLPLIANNKKNKIYFTLNFSSDNLIEVFEKKTPTIKERLKAIRTIKAYNIPLRIHIGPFIPYICSLKEIVSLVSEIAKEINVEIYHHKMGNFSEILEIIKRNFGKNMYNKVYTVYESEDNYLRFAKYLQNEIFLLQKQYNIRFFFILPEFDEYYNLRIDYKDSI